MMQIGIRRMQSRNLISLHGEFELGTLCLQIMPIMLTTTVIVPLLFVIYSTYNMINIITTQRNKALKEGYIATN